MEAMQPRRGRWSGAVVAQLFLWSGLASFDLAAAGSSPTRFLFVASPSTSNVYYVELPPTGLVTNATARVLIDGQASTCTQNCNEGAELGLKTPTGLALFRGPDSTTLYVSDKEAQNIYAYEIAGGSSPTHPLWWLGFSTPGPGSGLEVGAQRLVVEGVEGVSGIDVDASGNLFFTIESGQVQMVSAGSLDGKSAENVTTTAIYSSDKSPTVSSPVDVVTDGSNIFWANMAGGEIPGTVVTGPESSGTPRALAANGNGAMGICRAKGTIYYSGDATTLFAVKPGGGAIAQVSTNFEKPRGCAFDGENTLYVADEAGAVYSLPAIATLRATRKLRRVATVEAPMDVEIFTPTGHGLLGPMLKLYSAAPERRALSVGVLLACLLTAGRSM
eukprot:TRINITY_DN102332_c0_g1_i1.p1 TRINITY_DN102332_c0_g1~~TRINITY_DN102332_c0_g1_i1.p1  ORF type:complete len:388 (-),score=71.98 TRINITY_DN102332_c0_g1_i1:94-1257(-)